MGWSFAEQRCVPCFHLHHLPPSSAIRAINYFTCAEAVTTHDTFTHYQRAPKSQNFSQHFMTLLLLDALGMPTLDASCWAKIK